ncbi:MAG: methyltransferase domain-containing protein [Thermomicrobiales bacterium]
MMDERGPNLDDSPGSDLERATNGQRRATAHFADAAAIAGYADGPPRLVPGLASLHKMAMILLAERAPQDAKVLVLGAGGGMELKVFAEGQPGWAFDGVDPSAAMLHLAEESLGPLAARVHLREGYIESAPAGPFDAAACLLTLHYLPAADRLRTLRELRQRLRPGAPLVVAHFSFPQGDDERPLWLSRYAAFAAASGVERENAIAASQGIGDLLPLLSPEQDEALLREAGFSNVTLFYAGFTFRGWVAYA